MDCLTLGHLDFFLHEDLDTPTPKVTSSKTTYKTTPPPSNKHGSLSPTSVAEELHFYVIPTQSSKNPPKVLEKIGSSKISRPLAWSRIGSPESHMTYTSGLCNLKDLC